jgi:4-hydroxybenzoate polyprenyltransferase
LRNWLCASRPHQWIRNTLLFVPAFVALPPTGMDKAGTLLAAFCLTGSAMYVVNDLRDLDADLAHPRKRCRPFAAALSPARAGMRLGSVNTKCEVRRRPARS